MKEVYVLLANIDDASSSSHRSTSTSIVPCATLQYSADTASWMIGSPLLGVAA